MQKTKITDPLSIQVSTSAKFTERSLKHFIHSRLSQGNSWDEFTCLLQNARTITRLPQINILNPKQDKYPGSLLLGTYFEKLDKAIIAILDAGNEPKDIISLHFRKRKDFERLLYFADGGAAYPS